MTIDTDFREDKPEGMTSILLEVAQVKDQHAILHSKWKCGSSNTSYDRYIQNKNFILNELLTIFPDVGLEILNTGRTTHGGSILNGVFEFNISSDYNTLKKIYTEHLGYTSREFSYHIINEYEECFREKQTSLSFKIPKENTKIILDFVELKSFLIQELDDPKFQLDQKLSIKIPFREQTMTLDISGKKMHVDYVKSSIQEHVNSLSS